MEFIVTGIFYSMSLKKENLKLNSPALEFALIFLPV
jgi:hypothetical protein